MLLGHVLAQINQLLVLLVALVTSVRCLCRVRCEVEVEDGSRDERLVAGGTAERSWD